MSLKRLAIFFILLFSLHAVASNPDGCDVDDLSEFVSEADFSPNRQRVAQGIEEGADGSRGYRRVSSPDHPSVHHGNSRKTLIDRDVSRRRIQEMCLSGRPCLGAESSHVTHVQDLVDDEVFFSALGRNQNNGLSDSLAQNPYIASATDPTSGVYSIRQNEMPDLQSSNRTDISFVEETLDNHTRSDAIQSGLDDMRAHKREYLQEGGVELEGLTQAEIEELRFRDGSKVSVYESDGVRNGAAGTHAEVLAANGVLRFKDDIGRCIYRGACEGLPSCLPGNCSMTDWELIGDRYQVSFPDSFSSQCMSNPQNCFEAPSTGGHSPSSLFFDVRGATDGTITIGGDIRRLKKVPGNGLLGQMANNPKLIPESEYKKFLKKKGTGGPEIPSSTADEVILAIKEQCGSPIPREGNGCHLAYLRSVALFCKDNRSSCIQSAPSLSEARRHTTARITGQDPSAEIVQFGAGQRCFHCFHILGRQNFNSTLDSGVNPSAGHAH